MESDYARTGKDAGGPGGVVLFALPFALAGVRAAVYAVGAYRESARAEAISLGIFALVFCGVGFGLMAESLYGVRKAARVQAAKARRVRRPWPGRLERPVGDVDSGATQNLRAVWMAALLWNLFWSPFYFGLSDGLRGGSRLVLVGLVLPLIGIVLIILSLRARHRWQRFGGSTLQMADAFPSIGGRLVGRIISDRMPAGAASVTLRLTCRRREKLRRYGGGQLVWETEKMVPANPARATGAIPVEFDIPAHCEPSSEPDSSPPYVQWVLQATAEAPGMDWEHQFVVPVYSTSDAAAAALPEDADDADD
jgi:hypothetical protein